MNAHIIELRDEGWGLEHPNACRRAGSLLDCHIHKSVSLLMDAVDGPPEPVGRYIVTDDGSELLFTPVGEGS